MFRKSQVSILIPIICWNSCNNTFVSWYGTHITQEPASVFWCDAVMSLQSACELAEPLSAWTLSACKLITLSACKLAVSYDSYCVLPHVTAELRHICQVLQRHSDY